jgi:hypothetical protein
MNLRKSKAKKTRTPVYTVEVPTEYLTALRRAAGRLIDPETAEIACHAVGVVDPYGDLPYHEDNIAKDFFARVPETDLWIVSGDLPKATFHRICKRGRRSRLRETKKTSH